MAGDGLGAGPERDAALEIGGSVNLVGDFAAVAVEVGFAGPPAGGIPLGDDAVNALGGKEAVVNALFEAVSVNRVGVRQPGVCKRLWPRRPPAAGRGCTGTSWLPTLLPKRRP